MRLILGGTIAALALGVATAFAAGTETCFFKYDRVDGLNKICIYSCTSGEAAITVKSTQLCPLSIKR